MARINVSIPPDLLAAVDAARGDVPRSRWIQRALESALAPSLPNPLPPSRTPVETGDFGGHAAANADRQAKLNAAKAKR